MTTTTHDPNAVVSLLEERAKRGAVASAPTSQKGPVANTRKQRTPKPPPADWDKGVATDNPNRVPRAQLDVNVEGKIRRLVGNVMTIFTRDADWLDVIAYDLFRESPVITRQPPQREQDRVAILAGADWTPQDSTRGATWLFAEYSLEVAGGVVTEAMLAVAQRRIVHPVRTYLDALTWDGISRVDEFFAKYCRTASSEYTRGVARILFLSAVARVRRPGCKVDTIVVLEGPQGVFKSTLLSVLAGAWFADTPLPIGDKDAYQGLRGVWLYELAELVSLKGRDAARVKSFASSPTDHYRPSYEPRARAVPRQCIFVATTNEAHYLADATGARRFWPVSVGRVDLDAVRRDRDQLWAEADARVASGEPWWPTAQLEALGAGETEERYEGDPWEAPLEAWLAKPTKTTGEPLAASEGFSMSKVLTNALALPTERQDKRAQERAAQILRRAGWTREKNPRHVDNERVRHWFKGSGAGVVPGGGVVAGAKENKP